MKINESTKDKIVNKLLYTLSWIRSKVQFTNKLGHDEPDTDKMSLTFRDYFNSLDNWRIGQPWGSFHPEFIYQYYSEEAVKLNCGLKLNQFYSPKEFDHKDKKIVIPQAVGLITSQKSFGYGFYKFECKLPSGSGLWPAIWISCVDSWPPEIDILEAYSNDQSDWGKDLQSNFHFNLGENKDSSGSRNHPIPQSGERFSVSCWWTEKFIRIYYNGYLVRQITCKKTLSWFAGKKMLIILNNAIRKDYSDRYYMKYQFSSFTIYNVEVWQ
jgi:hypothetical protein